eukprot:maker-scaffold_5-snap-gene-20.7-mRNA-1 protein AED:0.00 eAED:0.00 QI:122/1/1/1/1/1/2/161/305
MTSYLVLFLLTTFFPKAIFTADLRTCENVLTGKPEPSRYDNFETLVHTQQLKENYSLNQQCEIYPTEYLTVHKISPECISSHCSRAIKDNFIPPADILTLTKTFKKYLRHSTVKMGPTIFDISSGYMMDSNGLRSLYAEGERFTQQEGALYQEVLNLMKSEVENEFQVEDLFFTAPTFVARLKGKQMNSSTEEAWTPKTMHDQYFCSHIDQRNTEHYFYSALLYLSDYETDFTGGEFLFLDGDKKHAILPRKGRLVMFQSGDTNLHKVNEVLAGERLTLSIWFTCNPAHKLQNVLQGYTVQREEL